MAKQKQALISDWTELNVETLPAQARMAYNKLKQAREAARVAKDAFETAARDGMDVPNGVRVVFAYNFGKLSIALAPDDAKQGKASAKAVSLTDWLKANTR